MADLTPRDCLLTTPYTLTEREDGSVTLTNVTSVAQSCPAEIALTPRFALRARTLLDEHGLNDTVTGSSITRYFADQPVGSSEQLYFRVQELIDALESETDPARAEELTAMLNQEIEALTNSLSQVQGVEEISGVEAETIQQMLALQQSLSSFHEAELGDKDVLRAAEELKSQFEKTKQLALSLRNKGEMAFAEQLTQAYAQAWQELVAQPDFAHTSGVFELHGLNQEPHPEMVSSLNQLIEAKTYLAEGQSSTTLVKVADILAKVRMLGEKPKHGFLSVKGLETLGWQESYNRHGYHDTAPATLTLSQNNALGKAVVAFKKYMRENGYAENLGDGVEITPQFAQALEYAWVNWGPYDQQDFSGQKAQEYALLFGPVKGVVKGAVSTVYDTLSWTGTACGALADQLTIPDGALEWVNDARRHYAALHPSMVQLAKFIKDNGANAALNQLWDRWDKGGLEQNAEAVGNVAAVAFGLGSLAAREMPSAISRVAQVASLVRKGELVAFIEAAQLGLDAGSKLIKGVYVVGTDAYRTAYVVGKTGMVIAFRLTSVVGKLGLSALRSVLATLAEQAARQMAKGKNYLNSVQERLYALRERMPTFVVGTREVRIPNPFSPLVSANGAPIDDDIVIQVPTLSLMASDEGEGMRVKRRVSGAPPGPRSAVDDLLVRETDRQDPRYIGRMNDADFLAQRDLHKCRFYALANSIIFSAKRAGMREIDLRKMEELVNRAYENFKANVKDARSSEEHPFPTPREAAASLNNVLRKSGILVEVTTQSPYSHDFKTQIGFRGVTGNREEDIVVVSAQNTRLSPTSLRNHAFSLYSFDPVTGEMVFFDQAVNRAYRFSSKRDYEIFLENDPTKGSFAWAVYSLKSSEGSALTPTEALQRIMEGNASANEALGGRVRRAGAAADAPPRAEAPVVDPKATLVADFDNFEPTLKDAVPPEHAPRQEARHRFSPETVRPTQPPMHQTSQARPISPLHLPARRIDYKAIAWIGAAIAAGAAAWHFLNEE